MSFQPGDVVRRKVGEEYSRNRRFSPFDTYVVRQVTPESGGFPPGLRLEGIDDTFDISKFELASEANVVIFGDEITQEFCEAYPDKASCSGWCASLIPHTLPEGVNPYDPRVKQIVRWCLENAQESNLPSTTEPT